MPCTKSRLDHAPAEARRSVATGRTNSAVVELVEVPLVARGSRAAARKRSRSCERRAGRGARRASRRAAMPAMRDQRRRPRAPSHSAPSLGVDVVRSASRRRSARGSSRSRRRRPGSGRTPPTIGEQRRASAIARAHRPARARRCGARAREAHVGVLGLAASPGSPARRGAQVAAARARAPPRTGVAAEDAEHHPERVEGGQASAPA